MLRTPCNAVADHQGATDPWLKTPVLYYYCYYCQYCCYCYCYYYCYCYCYYYC